MVMSKSSNKKQATKGGERLRVVELFAGVGGFRLGLEGWENKSALVGTECL